MNESVIHCAYTIDKHPRQLSLIYNATDLNITKICGEHGRKNRYRINNSHLVKIQKYFDNLWVTLLHNVCDSGRIFIETNLNFLELLLD